MGTSWKRSYKKRRIVRLSAKLIQLTALYYQYKQRLISNRVSAREPIAEYGADEFDFESEAEYIPRERRFRAAHERLSEYFEENNVDQLFKYTRMSPQQFNHLCDLVEPHLQKNSIKAPLAAELRLGVVLIYLSSGDPIDNIANMFRIGRSTVYKIVPEMCAILHKVLYPTYVPQPQSDEDWLEIAQGFENLWNFPNCVGALGGKHIKIKTPPNTGLQFPNNSCSIVLMATCDSNYRFTWLEVGEYVSLTEQNVWDDTKLCEALKTNTIKFPKPAMIANTGDILPHYLIGDESFPLETYLMRPFREGNELELNERVFNYRVCRPLLAIENSFGILFSKWRVLQNAIGVNAKSIVEATVCLHNYLMSSEDPETQYFVPGLVDEETSSGEVIPGAWRDGIEAFSNMQERTESSFKSEAVFYRSTLAENFLSEAGSVPWQWDRI